ncbi:MAG: beta-mannanase [Myxococcaceae bacterium]|nr:beta-mannanase [Myxococcaceae bacterium]
MIRTIRFVLAALSAGLVCTSLSCVQQSDNDAPVQGLIEQALETGPRVGLYHYDAPDGPAQVDAVSAWVGRPSTVAVAYSPGQTWDQLHNLGWQTSAWSKWVAVGPVRTLVYALSMLPGPGNGSGPDGKLGTADDVSLRACSAGSYDVHWRSVASQLADAGLGGSVIRLGWEFDGDWFPWSARGREADYAGCYRRIVDSMRQARPNAGFWFEWSTSDDIFWWDPAKVELAWPGDNYVDIIGVNAYDVSWENGSYPLPANCDATCLHNRRQIAWNDMIRGVNQQRERARAHGKVISIPEWGVWRMADGHGGGDNAEYIERMYNYVSDPNNLVVYHTYFDVNMPDGQHQLSDVGAKAANGTVAHNYQTLFPAAAAKYKQLFGRTP